MIVYFNGQYLKLEEVKISPFDRGFQYADGVYEVIRTYFGKLFRYADHLERLKDSLRETRINYTRTGELEECIYKLFELNKFTSPNISVYIQITRGEYFPRKHSFPPGEVNPTVFISTFPIEDEIAAFEKGIKVILEKDIRWSKCNIKSISLLPNVLSNQRAVEEGAEEAIWLRDGKLLEGSHTNFWGIKNNEVWTAPLSNFILPGVSRKVIFEICSNMGINVLEQAISENEINQFNEFFITGTTTEIKPVGFIGNVQIGDGLPGINTKKIYYAFLEYINRRIWD